MVLKKLYKIFLLLLLFMYFSTHLIYGDRGYINLKSLEQKKQVLEETHLALKRQRENIENNVKLLRSTSIDKNMLDEQARKQLGFIKKDEFILITN